MIGKLYREMVRIRRVEERIAEVYPTDKIKSPVHLSIGQEAVSVGVCAALEPRDVVFGTYRGHALYLAKAASMRAMIAELYGKETGCTHGRGGSMHLVEPSVGLMGTSAVVGTTIANAVGYAYALKLKRSDAIVAAFFGDGATDEGVFYESLNFACLKQLPVLFVCENNAYAIHTHQRLRQGRSDLCARAEALGIPAEHVENNDVLALVERSRSLVEAVRRGEPQFLEVMTYRWREHVGPNEDYHLGYRAHDEAAPWKDTDQVERLGRMIPALERERILAEVDAEIQGAFEFAENSPFPEPETLFAHAG